MTEASKNLLKQTVVGDAIGATLGMQNGDDEFQETCTTGGA
jgi:hypothetical protein